MRSVLPDALMVVFLSATLAAAQDVPKAELFGGYSFLQGNPTTTKGFTSNGWDASVTGNVNRWFGFEVNFSDHYGTSAQNLEFPSLSPPTGPFAYAPSFAFLVGPHFSFRSASRVTPFAHAPRRMTRESQQGLFSRLAKGKDRIDNVVCEYLVI